MKTDHVAEKEGKELEIAKETQKLNWWVFLFQRLCYTFESRQLRTGPTRTLTWPV